MVKKKVVLAYSGGLDTSMMLKWIQEEYKMDVISCILDVGQQKDLKVVEEKAWALGVLNHYTFDAKEEFAREYVFPAIKANALYMGTYPVSSSISRPLIAKKVVEVAEIEDADAVAHGCTGKGNDQVRFDLTFKAMNPHLQIIAPVREWKFDRNGQIAWAKEHGIPIPVTVDNPYSVDQNLWGRSIEGGILEHPDQMVPDEGVWEWTVDVEEAPNKAEYVKIGFHKGVPSSINGENMGPVEILLLLNIKGGEHGIGRIEHMEDRVVGLKTMETYETPAAEIILAAHHDLEKMVLTKHQKSFKFQIDHTWANIVYQGLWIDPFKEDLDAFIDSTQRNVTGEVTMELFKGRAKPVARVSPLSLYDYNLASFDINTHYDQGDAVGFINLWGLPSVSAWNLKRKIEAKGINELKKRVVSVPIGDK
ncbi:argininosuccinate synthase [Candidatus Bathyarchaeota archaeon]|jgi:argininosuccinate synthase|nr:argininosuccinate synthase [Candidatus Bathyarchaeota archaeon]MDP6049297.1 argininosuccinate synthase [Candidatus Bathyarchaeota archaeon]MDP7208036.1 argininosuccinate synthase [Candidatus Bathyarchaeota archaeon]MDP7443295.1 argininosuccinate synthase [Candidatus Bathyarchaeota archaeon]|tara:strand:+ start:2031 stop:3293 length:1263 start_codon:yes stop_codon:yes gene_type:complete